MKLFDESTKLMETQSYLTISLSISVYTDLYDHFTSYLLNIDSDELKSSLTIPIRDSQRKLTEMFNHEVLLSLSSII